MAIQPKKNRGLGKGLSNMFSVKSVADVLTPLQKEGKTTTLPISWLHPGKYQTRTTIDEGKIRDLANSIKEKGIINPIAVRCIEQNKYEILAGERRYRAALLAELQNVPVSILDLSDQEALEVGLIENLQREDLNSIETAKGIERLIDEFNYSHEQAAQAIGCSRPKVSNFLRLLNLPESIQQLICEGRLEMGHARTLLVLDKEVQEKVVDLICKKSLSVRQTEELVDRLKNNKKRKDKFQRSEEILNYEKELSSLLGLGVKLSANSRGKGKIQISFSNRSQFEQLIRKLKSDL